MSETKKEKCEACRYSKRIAGFFCYCAVRGNTVKMKDKKDCAKFEIRRNDCEKEASNI